MRDWQPIETAPHEGSFLVFHGGTAGWWMMVADGHALALSFAGGRSHRLCGRLWTHWMPLPDPPKVIEVERIPVSDDQSQAITEALHQGKKMAQ